MKPNLNPRDIPAFIRGGFSHARREVGRMRGTNVWTFIMYGLLLDTVNSLWRPFSAVFLQRLGGGELEIALLNALPGAVGALVLLPGAMLFRRFTDKKRATAIFILISRALILGVALVPMLPANVRPLLFIILLAVMNCPDSLSQTSLQSFLADVFGSGNQRGQAIALRTKFGQAIVPVVTITTGLIITFIPSTDEQRMVLYQIFFVMAFLFGLAEVAMFRRLRVEDPLEKTEEDKSSPSDWALIPIIIKDKNFLAFFIPALIFIFTWQAGWPLVAIHQVMVIEATEMWFAIFSLASGVAAFASGGLWQKWLRKRGNSWVLVVSAFLLGVNMFFFPITPNVQMMALVSVFAGFSAIGINAALLNVVLGATPDENRMVYLAFYNTCTSISLFIAPFFSHMLFGRFGNTVAMFIVGFMRIGATALIWVVFMYRRKAVVEEL